MSSSPETDRTTLSQGHSETAEHSGRNPYVFVVGCPRSGTTLLQRMLDHHPSLAVANDTHFIPRAVEKSAPQVIEKLIQGDAVPLSRELVEGVRSYHRFERLGIVDADVDLAWEASSTYQEFVAALYSHYARRNGKPLAGEKTPDYVRHLPLLHGMFPHVKSIHIIRDGRDVALSLLEWAHEKKGPGRLERWRDEPVAVSALWWRWQVESGRQSGAKLGPTRYREVQYEALVDRSEDILTQTTEFLGLPFASEMLTFHEGKARSLSDHSTVDAKKAWLPPTAGLRNWRTQMSARDVALFETLAGDLLGELGYEISIENTPSEIEELAQEFRQWWETSMSRKLARGRKQLSLVDVHTDSHST